MMDIFALQAEHRLYRVECWEAPSQDNKKYGRHHQIGVVSVSAIEAMDIVRQKHPTYRIDAVNPCGGVTYILANALSAFVGQEKP
jgi:hypothetical protein